MIEYPSIEDYIKTELHDKSDWERYRARTFKDFVEYVKSGIPYLTKKYTQKELEALIKEIVDKMTPIV